MLGRDGMVAMRSLTLAFLRPWTGALRFGIESAKIISGEFSSGAAE
jgi:hypothetical protein